MWDSITYSGGDFFENPWRLTALYNVGRRPCFVQSRTIILRQGQLNEEYYNSIIIKSALLFLELCLLRYEAISIPNNLYPVQFSRLICRRRKRNKTGVLCRVFSNTDLSIHLPYPLGIATKILLLRRLQ